MITPATQPVVDVEGLLVVEFTPAIYEIGSATCQVLINAEQRYYVNPIRPGFDILVLTDGSSVVFMPAKSTANGIGLGLATAGTRNSFSIQAIDSNGYYLNVGGLKFQAEFALLERYIRVDSDDRLDGTYRVSYVLTVSGSYKVDCTSGGLHISGSPFTLLVKPAQTDVSKSNVAGAGLTVATAGSVVSFRIQARDRFGNLQLYPPGMPMPEDFGVTLTGTANLRASVDFVIGSSFRVSVMATASGRYTILISSPGQIARPFAMRVLPSLPYAPSSSYGPSPPASATTGVLLRLPLTVRDALGNPISFAQDGVPSPAVTAVATPGPLVLQVLSSGAGFNALFNVTASGDYTLFFTVRGVSFADGQPSTIRVSHGPLSPNMSFVSGPGVSGGRADAGIFLYITALDAFGNPFLALTAGDVLLELAPASSEMSFSVSLPVVGGVAMVVYTVWLPCSPCTLSTKLQSYAVGLTPFFVSISRALAPTVVEARLEYGLAAVIITFDVPTDRGGLSGVFRCDGVVDASSTATVGSDAACTWVTDRRLRIVLGSDSSLLPLAPIAVKPGVVMSARRNSLSASGSASVQLPTAYAPSNPTLVGPSFLGPCDDMILDASASPGAGGRRLGYSWGVGIGAPGREALMDLLTASLGPTLMVGNASLGNICLQIDNFCFQMRDSSQYAKSAVIIIVDQSSCVL